MLKKTMVILITAILICSFASCASGNPEIAENRTENTMMTVNTEKTGTSETSEKEAIPPTDVQQNSDDITSQEDTKSVFESSSTDTKTIQSETSNNNKSTANQNSQQISSTESGKNSDIRTVENNIAKKNNSDTSVSASNPIESNPSDNSAKTNSSEKTSESVSTSTSVYTANTNGKLDTTDLFTNRDLNQSPDLSGAKTIQAANNTTETITEEGIYIITGSANNFTVRVEAGKEEKVQLILDNANITNSNFPVIYIVSADKCFITTNNESSLSVTGTFTSDGDTKTDAVIFSKDDIVLNGTGVLNINSSYGNGISGKDDIKITGGTYYITSAKDSIEANDSIAIYDGTFHITSSKDGFHSENDDDDTVGWIYIQNGSFTIKAVSDAIQATTVAQIDGGTFNLTAAEGIEATYVQINGGTINITSSDDGINAAQKSRNFGTPTIEFNGGITTIVMGQGDTDAVDANGNIIVNGGTIDITAQMSSFDYDGTAQYNGGTIIINGSQVNSIPQSMMGGRGGMGNMGSMGGTNRSFSGRGNRAF